MIVKLIVEGGNMKPGPAVSQQLGPMGINLGKVIEETNKATSGFKGMKVPVEINVNPKTKEFEILVNSPPVAELIKKELALEKGSGQAAKIKIGNLAIEQIISIAKTKKQDMLAKDLTKAVKLVLGSCVSIGSLVESKEPKEIILEIDQGKYSEEINKEITEVSEEKRKKLAEEFAQVSEKQKAMIKVEEQAAAEVAAPVVEEKEKKKAEEKEKKK